ncbi:MAG: PAS domain S-box protein [Casimicrobiaceae bacterium]
MKRARSIRSYLYAVLVVATLPLLAILVYEHVERYRDDLADARADVSDEALRVAALLSAFNQRTVERLTAISARPGVQALDPAHCDPIVADFVTLDPEFANLAVLDGSGRNVCSMLTARPGNASFAADKDWFKAAMAGKQVVSEPFVGPLSHVPVVVLAVPLRATSGAVIGAVVAAIDLRRVRGRLVQSNAHKDADRTVQVFSPAGIIVVRSGEPGEKNMIGEPLRGDPDLIKAMLGKPDGMVHTGSGATGVLHSWVSVPGAPWRVEVSRPTADIFGDARHAAAQSAVLAALGGMLALGAGLGFGERLRRQIGALATTAGAVGQGDFDIRAPEAGPRELVSVARELNRMLDIRAKAYRSLEASEARYSQIVETAQDGIWIVGAAHEITFVNDQMAAMLGYSKGEILGRPIEHFVDAESIAETQLKLEGYAQGHVSRHERRLRAKDGSTLWALVSAGPMYDSNGVYIGAMAMITDITARKAMEERLRELSRAVEQSPAAVMIADRDCSITYVNPKFEELTGFASVEAVGMNVRDLDSAPHFEGVLCEARGHVLSGGEWASELQHHRKDGEAYWAQVTSSPIRDVRGDVTRILTLHQDITIRRQTEAQLKQFNRTLRMLSECNHALVRATSEVELLQKVCDIVVGMGDYPLAWVGYAENDPGKSVTAMAHAGGKEEFIESARATWAESERGRGAAGRAIRSGQICVVDDLFSNPDYAPWREGALVHGFQAVVGLPLKNGEATFGVLLIYASTPGSIDDDEIKLLTELAEDLAFGIVSLRARDERVRAEGALKDLVTEQQSILGNAPIGIAFVKNRRIERCNQHFARIFGYAEAELVGQSARVLYPSDEAFEARGEEAYPVVAAGMTYKAESRFLRKDGTLVWTSDVFVTVDPGDPSKGAILVTEDVTERKQTEHDLLLRTQAVESSSNGVMLVDTTAPDQPIIYVNAAFERITGYRQAEVVGRNARFLAGNDRQQADLEALRGALRSACESTALLRNYRKDGSLFWNELAIAPVRNRDGNVTHFVGIINDVTQSILYQAELEHQANFDELTNLPNRNLLRDRLEHGIAHARRNDTGMAVVFIDLDRFKFVNDSLGNTAGDKVLRMVTERLRSCTREEDTVARQSSDEFVIILTHPKSDADITQSLQRILDVVAEPLDVDGHPVRISCSIGVSLFPQDGNDGATLLRNADVAMYRAKESGRNNYQLFAGEMNERIQARLLLEDGLLKGLQRGEFIVHYQPQLDVQSGLVAGCEALVRWQHPERGLIYPGQFIPLAEEMGLILPLGEWILRAACAQARIWQDAGLAPIRLAVNLSARQLGARGLSATIGRVLQETGLAARWLELELTESAVMENPEEGAAVIAELKSLGVTVSIDDFGTGYSSMSYIKRLSIDGVKLDQSFVRGIPHDRHDVAITLAIMQLGRSLGLRMTAEGVETEEQRDFLRTHGCDEYQGYLFSRPLPAEQMEALLASERVSRSRS